ncbi:MULTISPECIES: hypothetical protein [Methanobacterium]|uniref:Uncharacterized protein n=1 Tax=Methanobacterium bryantii TaxID=2161 RepID=A0A2A2H8U9_METBR|nr:MULTISPECIES: hypothetical protein [Methanobacterium]OEC87869.1 hypothetical protein A9507_06755 [Methanobacterium sp. A39]PAV05736.1 hypothetical protein ASJ80_08365 [Methanobacterium bryantii]
MNSKSTFKSLTLVFKESPDIKTRVDELLDGHMSLSHIGHTIFEEYNITFSLDDLRLYATFIHRNPCIVALERSG